MSRFVDKIRSYWRQLGVVIRNEYQHIFTDSGVILVLILALLIYSTVYALAYNKQVLRNVPIGVIDMSKSGTSRQLINTFNAGPNTYVAYEPTNMEEAKQLFFGRSIYGIVYIPKDYEKQLLGGSQAVVSIYVDASYFLMYRQVFQEIVSSIGATGTMVEFQRLIAKGANIPQASATSQPVIYQSHNLFNPYLGYGSFVMPAIIIVIIQQTLLIGIGMIGGTWREFGLYRKLVPPGERRLSTFPIIMGKTMAYASVYAITSFYILNLHYKLFHYPMNGDPITVFLLMIPYILACILMGIAVSTLFRRRENSLLILLWTSIPILLLSGISFPREAMPNWLYTFGQIFPSSSGVNAFIRVQSMGASFADILPEIRMLWSLVIVYGGLAGLGIHLILKQDQQDYESQQRKGGQE
ncbi:MAG: ABC transporter permease [Alistipes sp.]